MVKLYFICWNYSLSSGLHQAITWAKGDPDLCCHLASLDHNELKGIPYCWPSEQQIHFTSSFSTHVCLGPAMRRHQELFSEWDSSIVCPLFWLWFRFGSIIFWYSLSKVKSNQSFLIIYITIKMSSKGTKHWNWSHHSNSLQLDQLLDHFVYAPSQWETTLQYNVISHWLGTCTAWPLQLFKPCHTTH